MYVDKRLAGIQAVQTLSRLNRAHPGKDTTYILDFVNEPDDVLAAFKPYYETAELAGVTDPNLVYDLRAKLDASGYYDDFEVERVVAVELDPKATQAQLSAAVEPVADRLLKRYKAEREALRSRQGQTGRRRRAGRQGRDQRADPLQAQPRDASCASTPSSPRSSTTATPPSRSGRSSSAACCRCWSSGASARGSISPRCSSPTTPCATRAGGICRSG